MFALKKTSAGELRFLDISAIRPNPSQPRGRIGGEELAALTESVRRYGVLQPITVRTVDGGFQLIAGERRLRAAATAGLTRIPALVIKADDCAGALMALVENEQREDLHFFDEAAALAELMSRYGLTQEALAGAIGKTQSAVANKLRLLRLPQSVRARVREVRLTERHARILLRLSDEKVMQEALDTITSEGLTVKETEELVEKMVLSAPAPERHTGERRRFCLVLRDYKPLFNTIRRTVAEMKRAGVDARYSEERNEEGDTVITLILPGEKNAAINQRKIR
ncbi:MAG: ParB/RepB/Spo0J family partition protein [Eubacteriales bacterium]|nr:ParB/RepB/Spo0J family partition protein [Eubacteriales bacterium]